MFPIFQDVNVKDLLTLRKTFNVLAMDFHNEAAVRWSLRLARVLGVFVFLGGLTGFLGWALDIRRLADWEGNGIPILPNTTVLMMLAGIGLILLATGKQRIGSFFGIAAGTIGFATFSQYLHGVSLGIDHLLLMGRDWGASVTVAPGRMGPPASFSWTLLLCAFLLLLGGGRSRRFVPFFALAVLLIASLSFTGYLMGADTLYAMPSLTVIAWQTSALFIALSVGLLAAMPDTTPTCLITEDSISGVLMRRITLPVVILPLAAGAIRVAGQNAGYYDTAMGTSLLVVFLIAVFLLILLTVAAISSRLERDKREADEFATSAEHAIRSSEERFRSLIEEAPFGVYIVDSDFRIAVINKGSQQRAFENVNPAVGVPFDDAIRVLWPEDVANDVIARLRHTLETGEPYFSKDFISPRADTDAVEGYEWELHQTKMTDGRNAVICYYYDSTELRTAQMELAQLNHELENRVHLRTIALSEANVALNQEMNARVASEKERVSVLARMMSAQEDERRRIAAELHDQLGQHMTALRLRLIALQNQAAGNGISDSIRQIMQIAQELDTDLDAVTLSLRPRALDTLGLGEALADYVRKWQNKSGVTAEFHSNGYRERMLTAEAETALFRITQEALHNCTKHSQASLVNILLGVRGGSMTLVIEDDGCGFDTNKLSGSDGLGLTSMSERCEMVGGEFIIESRKKGGTTIIVAIPINK